ncbi:hypothetical protein C0J52_04876 [Blattella germanica]|nr:hypothetical protein C0J52_04876 [Blattella germanica]
MKLNARTLFWNGVRWPLMHTESAGVSRYARFTDFIVKKEYNKGVLQPRISAVPPAYESMSHILGCRCPHLTIRYLATRCRHVV